MKFLRLIIKNVGRNKRRTVLTVLSVSVSVFLLATMQAVIAALGSISELTFSLVLGFVGGLLPSRLAARMPITKALREI